ncbi:MAG: hypothetical protein ACOCZA_08230 [Spirochaetota bacterium]
MQPGIREIKKMAKAKPTMEGAGVHGIGIKPVYADMYIPPGVSLMLPTAAERNAFAYVYGGSVCFSDERDPFSHPTEAERWHDTHPPAEAENRTLVLFDRGEQIKLSSGTW